MNTDYPIYPGKTFTDICKEIHTNQIQRKAQIESLISELRKMCVKIDDLPLILPYLQDYITALNVNDDHLIRFAGIIQKLMIAEEQAKIAGGSGSGLSEEERKMIMSEIDGIMTSDQALVKVIENK